MNKQQLASKIWESANQMRSKIEANEYKDYILGFIFYKFLSDTEVRFLEENDFSEENVYSLSIPTILTNLLKREYCLLVKPVMGYILYMVCLFL